MTTLAEAHSLASRYWATKGGTTGTVMAMRAEQCVKLAGWGWDRKVSSLTALDGTKLLTRLHPLAISSRASYYAAFRRMLALAGVSTLDWPKAGHAPRRVREPMPREAAEGLAQWFATQGSPSTANLVEALLGTGMRVEVEALSRDAWDLRSDQTLKITGKGGHERVIPVGDRPRLILAKGRGAFGGLSYGAHLKRWHKGVEALGITSKLPTPHSLRHLYATEAFRRSGGNLHVVRELLGHADINTTARYVGVNMEDLRNAVA